MPWDCEVQWAVSRMLVWADAGAEPELRKPQQGVTDALLRCLTLHCETSSGWWSLTNPEAEGSGAIFS
jgi:hypothetical protein